MHSLFLKVNADEIIIMSFFSSSVHVIRSLERALYVIVCLLLCVSSIYWPVTGHCFLLCSELESWSSKCTLLLRTWREQVPPKRC